MATGKYTPGRSSWDSCRAATEYRGGQNATEYRGGLAVATFTQGPAGPGIPREGDWTADGECCMMEIQRTLEFMKGENHA